MPDVVLATSERDDERPRPAGADPRWQDSWYLDFADGEGVGGFVRLAFLPHRGVAWWWCHLVVDGRIVIVRDHAVPLPRAGLEVRAEGLWADLVCETPMEHWTIGVEAFGVAVDGPLDALGRPGDDEPWGERIAVGLDLEWEALGPWADQPVSRPDRGHYQHAGIVHGAVLLGDRRIPFDGAGERVRDWGVRDWWRRGWHWAAVQGPGGAWSASAAVLDGDDYSVGYSAREGTDPRPLRHLRVETLDDADGLPRGARYHVGESDDGDDGGDAAALLEAESEVLALVPIPLAADDGRRSVLWRALCRTTTRAGVGHGWAEWLRVAP
jgi:hypothetical protein